jgi:hypothetical protein
VRSWAPEQFSCIWSGFGKASVFSEEAFLDLAWSWRGISVVGKRHPVNRRSSSALISTAAKGGVKSQYQSSRIVSFFVGNAPLTRRRNLQVKNGTERDRISSFCESCTTKHWYRNAMQCRSISGASPGRKRFDLKILI